MYYGHEFALRILEVYLNAVGALNCSVDQKVKLLSRLAKLIAFVSQQLKPGFLSCFEKRSINILKCCLFQKNACNSVSGAGGLFHQSAIDSADEEAQGLFYEHIQPCIPVVSQSSASELLGPG